MILLWMSIAGTIPLIIFLATWAVQRNSFNYTLGKSLLFISIGFYLIPVQLLIRLLPDRLYESTVVNKIQSVNNVQFHFEYGNSTYVTIDDGIMWIPNIVLYIFAIWFVIVLFFSVYEIIKYKILMNGLLRDTVEKVYYIEHFGNANILISNKVQTPYTVGFIHSRIIFPEILTESEYFESIYTHEKSHANNHDALVKLICLIIMCLHWFNPFIILLLFSYGHLSEYISDDYATRNLSSVDRKGYASLLLEDDIPKVVPVVWRNNFLGTKLLIKRRITYIMKKRMNNIQKLVTVVVSAVSLILSSATVFAYEPLQSSNGEAILELEDGDFMEFVPADEANNEISFSELHSDDCFISDAGEIIVVTDNNLCDYAICNHTYMSGTYNKHMSNGNGGCTVKVYNAKICTKCNYLVVGDLIQTNIYTVCPH